MNEEEEKKKNCFLMFYDWEPLLRMLSDEEAGSLLFALYAYEIRGEQPPEGTLSPQAVNLFKYLSKLFDDSKKSWYDKRKAGSKGGKKSAENKQTSSNTQADPEQNPSRPQAEVKQNQPKEKEKEKEKDKVLSSDEDKNKKATKSRVFVPPTLEEVETEIQAKGHHVDALEFFNYYDSQAWKKANGQRVSNWKGCLVTWDRKNRQNEKGQTQTQDSVTDWDKIAKEVEQLGYFDNVNNYANVRTGIPATVREDVGG